jgi:tRNA-2-methylthio-N6-dimethylallyladenosine synthase
MHPKRFFIHTIGCQMNVYDAELMAMGLGRLGYLPAGAVAEADLVVVNTCSVRDKAETKAFSIIGRLAELQRRRPGLIVAVAGCVAQQEGERIFSRAPHVRIVIGTGAVNRLPAAVREAEAHNGRILDLHPLEDAEAPWGLPGDDAVARFVTIMRGCDNFCAYCIVPFVRGREISRPPERIIHEIEALVGRGVREVTLLGQNVNSYGKKERLCSFAELLARVDAVAGLQRIRFTTSHPKDLTGELMECFAHLETLCPHIHLPVQAGSDRILERMNRQYTRAQYLDKVSELRNSCPQIAITSDIIVGFPGETQTDFEETLDLVRRVEFDGVFAFTYSDRPHAPASRFSDKLPQQEKSERLQTLLKLQERITYQKNGALVGSVQEVLVEGFSKRRPGSIGLQESGPQWTGRTLHNKIANFHSGAGCAGRQPLAAGQLVGVRIERALAHSLWGVLDQGERSAGPLKGVGHHAA